MIEINFLPVKYRKRNIQLPDLSEIKAIPIIIGVFSFLIGVYLILSIILAVKTGALNRLNNEWQGMTGEKQHVDEIKKEIKYFKGKADLIDKLVGGRMLWAKKLNQLSDLIPDGIWLENLELGSRKDQQVLILKGNVFSRSKEETALTGDFIKSLRDNREFFADFSDIELESIKRHKLGETEVMEFNLILFMVNPI